MLLLWLTWFGFPQAAELELKLPWLEFEEQRRIGSKAKQEYEAAQKAFNSYESSKRAPLAKAIKSATEKKKFKINFFIKFLFFFFPRKTGKSKESSSK
jgi:hypothetical protein